MLLLSVSVGRLVVCVCFVCMGLCCPHTRYSGLCCCCLAGCCPPSSGGGGCTACTLNSIMPCLCVDTISYIWCVCVCVSRTHTHTHPRHHQPSPTPAHASAYEHGTVYAPNYLQHSFMIVVVIIYISRPQVERQYPPNLSILISGGKETNRDSLSSGERSGRSPSSESGRAPSPCPELWSHGKASLSAVAGRAKVPWKRAPGRVTAPSIGPASRPSRLRCCTCPRVGLFGNAALSGW